MSVQKGAIGVFDTGLGGLTVLKEFIHFLPQYNYLYLGDNARAPYGNRSFETVYRYTLQCVEYLFSQGCPLVILACNTASAKALRNIQQTYLPARNDGRRVLGVIRPTTEIAGELTRTGHIALMATQGTVRSDSYAIELRKFFPKIHLYQKGCPMFVPLIENREAESPAAAYFIQKYTDEVLSASPEIDTILLGCTHYPLFSKGIEEHLHSIGRDDVRVVAQGEIVARSLKDYLGRHPEMQQRICQEGNVRFVTTDSSQDFFKYGSLLFEGITPPEHIDLF